VQKCLQFSVFLNRRENPVVGNNQIARLHAGIVPGGDISAVGAAFVHPTLLAEIVGRIEIGHAVEQDAGFMGVRGIAGDDVRGCQIADTRHDRLLPLAVDQIGPDETPSFLAVDITLAVIDTETMERIVGVGMLGIEE